MVFQNSYNIQISILHICCPTSQKLYVLHFLLDYRNDPVKIDWCTLALCLEGSNRKYFRILIDYVGEWVSTIIYLFYKSPITTILNFNLSSLPSDVIFSLYTSIYRVTVSYLLGSSIIKFWLLIKFLIYFKLAFIQAFLASEVNLKTSTKFLGFGINWDTSEPDSPKLGNEFFNCFTTALNTFCKTLTISFSESSAPFHSFCYCLIWSNIFNITSLALIFGCM